MPSYAPAAGQHKRFHVIVLNLETGEAKTLGNELPIIYCEKLISEFKPEDFKNLK